MKESILFLAFIKKNFLILFIPAILGLLLSIFFYASEPSQTKLAQSFKLEYSLENLDSVFALADQAVSELRLQSFDLKFPNSKATIYKPGPLAISIEVLSRDRDTGFALLIKETEYLRQNFSVSTLTQPEITLVEPNLLKYLLSGLLLGFLIGLIVSLIREYLKNY